MTQGEPEPGERLEQALELFLAASSSADQDTSKLPGQHGELRELLEAMVEVDGAPAHADDQREVLGDFRLVRELGRGGMGIVYEAWQRSLDRRVALKLLAPAMVASPSAVARFRREAAAAGRLHHPGIVEVFGFASVGDQHFFAMEYVEGEPLHRCAAAFHELPAALALVVQVTEALQHAHAAGLVHRDVKPANVMVRPDRRAALTDFGLASDEALPSITTDGSFLGTLDYAAPEQVRGERVDARADVWAVGVMLFELLAGKHPFTGPTQAMTMHNILGEEPPPLRRLRPELPADVAAVVARALSKDPARRYASSPALLADLRALQQGARVTAREPGPVERLQRWARREPWRAFAAVAVLALLVATTIGYWVARERADENGRLATRLAGKVRDFDQLAGAVLYGRAVDRERDLYPAWPERIPAMEAWLRDDCDALLAMQPQIERTLVELRAEAEPATPAQQEADRRSHPQFGLLQQLQGRLVSLQRAQAIAAGRVRLEVPPLDVAVTARSAIDWNTLAWDRVAPRLEERKVWGEEAYGLACARAAVEQGRGTATEQQVLDTLAWALWTNGQDDDARKASDTAVAKAPPTEVEAYRGFRHSLESAIERRAAFLTEFGPPGEALAKEVAQRRTFHFREPAQSYLYEALCGLTDSLLILRDRLRAGVEHRLRWARSVRALTEHHPNARVDWATARAAIAKADGVVASERYRGLTLPLASDDVLGLVPIGMNPKTKLWEFYDLRSAWDGKCDPATVAIPTHDGDGGIAVDDSTGIVLVLLPGGTFTMGAQRTDPSAPNFDPDAQDFMGPVQELHLAPFFLARHELTKGQWLRLDNDDLMSMDPSFHRLGNDDLRGGRITLRHPIENVSWEMSDRLLRHSGLTLPTQGQWEHAYRGGTQTANWAGLTAADLAGCANVLDVTGARTMPQWGKAGPFDDGCVVHAPVGSFRPNPFGLYDIAGNVWEWVRDRGHSYFFTYRDGEGECTHGDRPDARCYMGGAFDMPVAMARPSNWGMNLTTTRSGNLGVRPARAVVAR